MKVEGFEPYKIFEFGKIELSQEDIAKFAPRHLQFVGQSCLAANDINILLKVILGYFEMEGPGEVLEQLSSLTRIVIQRQLQSKIFEFIQLVDEYHKICIRRKDKVLGSLLDGIPKCTDVIKGSPCFEFSRLIRNKVTSHYAFLEWHAGAKRQKKGHKFRLYMHKINGNTFYPLAEDASHLSLFDEAEFGGISYDDLFEWMASSTKMLVSMQQEILMKIFLPYIPGFRLQQTVSYVPNRLVFSEGTRHPLLSLLNGSGRW
jgi:hypothetical protein